MHGLAVGFQHETFRVRDLTMGKILFRQAFIYHPPSSEEPGARPPCANPAAKYLRHVPRRAGITGFSPQLGHLEAIPKGPETGALGNNAEADERGSEE